MDPPMYTSRCNDTIVDLTEYNVTDYVVKTEDKYKKHRLVNLWKDGLVMDTHTLSQSIISQKY